MDVLKKKEDELLDTFSAYIKAEEKHLATLRGSRVLLALYLHQIGDGEGSEPLTAYQLMQRLRVEWATIMKFTKKSLFQNYQDLMEEEFHELPTEDDVDGAALGIIRLQEMYKLYPENITTNPLTGISFDLKWERSFKLGKVAYSHESYQHAFLWFFKSLQKLGATKEENSDTYKKLLLEYLSSSAYEFGHVPLAVYFSKQRVNIDPGDLQARLDLTVYKGKLSQHTKTPDIFTLSETSTSTYEALCRGEELNMKSRRRRQLSCRYSTGGGNPRLMYAPVKEEEVWDDPPIMTYHDVFSEAEIEQLKNLSRPWLERSKVSTEDGYGGISYNRVSQTVWLKDEDAPVVSSVSQRLSDITGLGMESAEPLQVLNYGVGGHFSPHYDTLERSSDSLDGDRMATIMIYLSDVSYGGSTVFPEIGASVKPQKGSVVMWYNLLRNGQGDWRSLHGGCPVYQGSKWVAVKWVHERGQEFRRQCSLSETE
ncbi:prolyl 4-hydroxylase subunit alpha-2 [Astyanax mexicanus]|uniref:prolyl 4-hydroxylase subunit alpha-2 n=1 Tax=Astyanax mexicanus TaxID=7994 RepID=UPI0020CB32EC|nr:prolyl 4-hydroxylase subunit alpha-2 [Astyanax mexicanus]